MRKLLLLITSICFITLLPAQVSKTVNVTTAGTLSMLLTEHEDSTVTNLTVTGTIDSLDFVTMKTISTLKVLELSGASCVNIPVSAFKYSNLTSITIPSSITSIGASAFSFCYNLSSINIPLSVTSIGNGVFEYCRQLNSISIPSSVTTIGNRAFFNCNRLTSITIPSSISSIGDSAFWNNEIITITIPASVSHIGIHAFNNISSINLDSNNPFYSIMNGVLYNKSKTTLLYCLTNINGSYNIPNSVDTISKDAFYNCMILTSITIPSSVISIGTNAFYNCSSLSSITIPSSVTSIGDSAFYNCKGINTITIPASIVSIGANAFYGIDSINVDSNNQVYSTIASVIFNKSKTILISCPVSMQGNYNIPITVNTIKNDAFFGCNSLSSITIPLSVTSIEYQAFKNCYGLTSIIIPSSITSIEKGTFYNCEILKSITIPSSVTSIGDGAFDSCYFLTSVIIPSSVTSIGEFAFCGCNFLQSIYVYSNIPVNLSNSEYVFYGIDKSTCNLYVPAGSLASYHSANQWQDFNHIIEMETLNTDSTITLYPQANTMSIFVQSSGNWTATSSVPWLSLSPQSGTGNDSLKIIAQANPTDSIRTATITVSSDASVSLKSSNTKTIIVTQTAGMATGFTTLKNEDFTLFPNPTTTGFSINNEGEAKVEIYGLNGNLVLNTLTIGREAIPVSKLTAGMYIVKIITPTKVLTKRLVVE